MTSISPLMVLLAAPAGRSGGAVPLVLLILFMAWGIFLFSALRLFRRLGNEFSVTGFVSLVLVLLLSLLWSSLMAPPPPVVSTFTGLGHVISSLQIARLDWGAFFPYEYPLAIPVWGSLFQHVGFIPTEAFSWANRSLYGLGALGFFLVGAKVYGRLSWAWLGVLVWWGMAAMLLYSASDALSLGTAVLSVWGLVFLLELRERADSRLARFAFAALLVLLVQSRLEALVLVLPLVLMAAGWLDRNGRAAFAKALVLAGVFSLPALVWTLRAMATNAGASGLGLRLVPGILVATVAVIGFVFVHHLLVRKGSVTWWISVGVFAALVVLMSWSFGFGVWGSGPMVLPFKGEMLRTYRTVGAWVFNHKMVCLTWWLLAVLGLLSRRSLAEKSGWILWIGLVVAASTLRSSGELPFEGLRTQLPTFVPLTFLVVAGVEALSLLPWRMVSRWGVAFVLLVGIWPSTLRPVREFNYAAQQEWRFLWDVLPTLPHGATVFVPDAPILVPGMPELRVNRYGLFRYGRVAASLGLAASGEVRLRPMSRMTTPPRRDSYVFLGLGCYRTGTKKLLPQCRCVLDSVSSVVARRAIFVGQYTSDFLDELVIVNNPAEVALVPITETTEFRCKFSSK